MSSRDSSSFHDKRGGKFIYVSSCLLNQNRRFPGIAVSEGAIPGLFEEIMRNGIGIEQLPCPECLGWGGISRDSVFRFIPIFYRYSGSRLYPLIKAMGRVWLYKYRRLCKRRAHEIVRDIKSARSSGYRILSIIAMNDSPTCGATRKLSILDMVANLKERGLRVKDIECPQFDMMRKHLPNLLVAGQGHFMSELINGLKQNGIVIPVLAYDPWSDPQKETDRLTETLLEL